jgi:inosose dehydratase
MRKTTSTIDRRRFLRGSLVLTGTVVATGIGPLIWTGCGGIEEPPQLEAPTPEQEVTELYQHFKMGFQSYSLRHLSSLDDFLPEAAKLNLGYVELWRGHLAPFASRGQIEETRGRLAGAGLTVNAFGVEELTSDAEKNQALFEFGRALQISNLNVSPPKDSVAGLQKWVSQYGIVVAIHNGGPEDSRWETPEQILEVVKDLDPRIGACADLGQFIRSDVNPVEAIEMLGSRVLGVHLADFDRQGREVTVGQGELDVKKTLSALKQVGFDGPLSLGFEGIEGDPMPKMLESLSAIREALQEI